MCGFLSEVEQLRKSNLIRGGSLENAVVLSQDTILSGKLRAHDEFVRHKILDAIGDLYLLGACLLGEFSGFKSGHNLNNALLRRLLDQPQCYEEVAFEEAHQVPISYQLVPGLSD